MTDDAPAHGGITRRQAVAGAAALGLTGALAGAHAQTAAPTARGSVFEDTDGSFRRGPGSKGVSDVLVSNGRDVAKTDAATAPTTPRRCARPGSASWS